MKSYNLTFGETGSPPSRQEIVAPERSYADGRAWTPRARPQRTRCGDRGRENTAPRLHSTTTIILTGQKGVR